MVANKIKSTTSPIEFHGHIWHQSLMSRVSIAILSTGLLRSFPHTPQQNRPLHHSFTGRALTGHETVIARSWTNPTEISLTVFFSLWAGKGQNLQASPFFFLKRGENCVDFGVSFVSLHPRSEGSSNFYRPYGWHFDFSSILLTLMSTPVIFFARDILRCQGGMCNIYCIYLMHYALCPERPLQSERLEQKGSITGTPLTWFLCFHTQSCLSLPSLIL